MHKKIVSFFFVLFVASLLYAKQFEIISPDNKLSVKLNVGEKVNYSICAEDEVLINPSEIALILEDGTVFGNNPRIKNIKRTFIDEQIKTFFYKKSEIRDNYNELRIDFKDNFSIIFRVYNEGVAYRFVSSRKTDFRVTNEISEFNFNKDYYAYIPYVRYKRDSFKEQFFNSFENSYSYQLISKWEEDRIAFLPILLETHSGKKVCITEADLIDYPGMYLYNPDKSNRLKAIFPPYPKTVKQGGYNNLQGMIEEYESFIAKSAAKTNFPWRIVIVSSKDKELLNNDMVYKLASPSKVNDVSWIKPGKVVWEWWNSWNLSGVDFETGINNETYKYYIDFASKNNIEYIIMDEGWSVKQKTDLFCIVPEIDLNELVRYATEKNVGIILWAGYYAFNKDIEKICKHYAEMGIKGFKVDFMDRDDQKMVEFHYKAAEIAAKYHLLLDFHGTYKPTGLQRTFPNVINFEGVLGLENVKWNNDYDQVGYDVTIPFIRQVAGPMDYTQGAMRNATKSNFRAIRTDAMSQGTRCRQLAKYIIFESPLNMLCDSPTNYEREQECTDFISEIPTVWDETIELDGKVAKYVSIARRKNLEWYVGALTNWDSRELELDLTFLGEGNYVAELYKDGVNADKIAIDYKKETIKIPASKKIIVKMAPGGGFVAHIYKL